MRDDSKVEQKTHDLPPDNVARLAIYDAISCGDPHGAPPTADELFDRVIGRLRMLVPRELHLTGERPYLDEKLVLCIKAGIIEAGSRDERTVLALTGQAPQVRYPDGEIRDYTPGLELARERIDRDNSRLRDARFDIRTCLPSTADDPSGAAFQTLLTSMREHGFLKQYPIVKYQDDVVIDGRARLLAAAMLHLNPEYMKYGSNKDRTAARRRDSPLNRIVLALHTNACRLSDGVLNNIHMLVAKATGRSWAETLVDLELTADWRRATPGEYSPVFEVTRYSYRTGDEPRVQVTPDHKVMLRSLIEAAGLSNYKIDVLRDYVPFERARSVHSAGRKAVFARVEDLIEGIATMQVDRKGSKLKLDPEWEQIRDWLITTFAATVASDVSGEREIDLQRGRAERRRHGSST